MRARVELVITAALVLACGPSGKSASSPCGPKDDLKKAGRTGAEGAKTGVTTGVEGVKTFGSATAGLFEGGSDEAKRRWREGKEKTKDTAHEGSAATKAEYHAEPCR